MRKSKQLPQLTVLTVALAAALAAMAPTVALATDQTISSNSGAVSQLAGDSGNITITSTGIISTSGNALSNHGTIVTLSNSGQISASSANGFGINNVGTIGTLNNSGIISVIGNMISNTGFIGTLNNTGTISHGRTGIYNNNTIGMLSNSGSIQVSVTGINTSGTIGTLRNTGSIQGGTYGLENWSTVDTLSNSGLISGGSAAIINTNANASIGSITNSGTIAGNIINNAAHDLVINGGAGSVFGTLTGFGGTIGTITNTSSNVVFGTGNQLLNNNINVGSNTVLNIAGTLQVNNPLSITGNYLQSAGATLKIGVADNAVVNAITSDSGYGRLLVSGSAVITSGSAVTLTKLNSYGFAGGQRYLVVQAATAGTDFHADSLVYTLAGFKLSGQSVIDGSNTNLILTVAGNSGTVATTSDAISSMSGLSQYTGTNAGIMNLFNATAALNTTPEANRAGAQLSPTATTAGSTQAATASTAQVLTVATAHLDTLRVAQVGGTGVSTGENPNYPAVWGQTFGGQANQGARDGVSGYRANYYGLLFGSDAMVNDNWRAGGLISYGNTSLKNSGDNTGSSSRLNSYGLFGYAGYTASAWYSDLSVGVVQHKFTTQRAINFNGFSGDAEGAHDGLQYVLSAQAGRPIQLDALMSNTAVTPIVGLTYSGLRQNRYTETGGNGAALQVDATTSTSIKSDLAVKLERLFSTSYGNLVPAVQLGWRHEYKNTRLQSLSSFAADTTGTANFISTAPTQNADTAVVGISMTLIRSKDLALAVRYTWEGISGQSAQTADIKVRYQF